MQLQKLMKYKIEEDFLEDINFKSEDPLERK